MGNEVIPRALDGRAWRLVHLVSRLLEPAERDAVCGDFAESGTDSLHALRDVIGLVVRRQVVPWSDWRPWFVLIGIVAPIGLLLSHAARAWADRHAVYAFLYVNHWTWLFWEIPGARRDLIVHAGDAALGALALVGWSWASGFMLSALSRHTARITLLLLCLAVLLGTAGTTTMARSHAQAYLFNGGVFAVPFYDDVFPRLARVLFVVVPAWLGMRRSLERRTLNLLPALAGAGTIAWLTAWPGTGLATSILRDRQLLIAEPGSEGLIPTEWIPLVRSSVSLLIVWPVASIVAIAAWHRWNKQTPA